MEQPTLTKDLIADARLWRMSLRVSATELHVMLWSTVADGSLISRTIVLTGDDPVRALEEAVYDNPLLLADYARVDCVIATERFTVVPPDITGDEERRLVMQELYPGEGEVDAVIANTLDSRGTTLLMAPERGLTGFLRRTFNNPAIHHTLTPLCRYFQAKSRYGNTRKMYAHFSKDTVSVISFGREGLRIANIYRYHDPMDAVYYILAARKLLGLTPTDDELLLSGRSDVREKVMPVLREYHSFVMPVIFPSSMFRAGKEALNTPFELIVLPLCE